MIRTEVTTARQGDFAGLPEAWSRQELQRLTRRYTSEIIGILPDILANAGGVTVSYFEWVQDTQNYTWSLEEINRRLHQIMTEAFHRTLLRASRDRVDMRTAALVEGIQRVAEAKLLRGLFP